MFLGSYEAEIKSGNITIPWDLPCDKNYIWSLRLDGTLYYIAFYEETSKDASIFEYIATVCSGKLKLSNNEWEIPKKCLDKLKIEKCKFHGMDEYFILSCEDQYMKRKTINDFIKLLEEQ